MESAMPEGCRERIYSEDYLDFLVEYFGDGLVFGTIENDYCYKEASSLSRIILVSAAIPCARR